MKLALALEYPIGMQGGVSVLVAVLAKELARQGHEIVLVSPDSRDSMQASEAGRAVRHHFHWDPQKVSPTTARDLARRLAEARVELAHFHFGGNYGWGNRFVGYCPVVHLARRSVPCFSTVHLTVNVFDGYCGPQKPGWFKLFILPLAWWAKTRQLKHVRCEIAVSRHDLANLRRWYWPFREKFVQIYHSRLSAETSTSPSVPRNQVVLNVGHLAVRKGQFTLAEAFARIAPRHTKWTLQFAGHDAGDGTFQRICQMAQDRHLEGRIVLLGERTDALELMRRAAIYVQPSTAEALGLALQEAMFCGCACVGARTGGIPELLQDGRTGRLVDPGNVEQMAAAMDELIHGAAQRETLGRAAAEYIHSKGMTAEAMSKRYLEIYAAIGRKE
jgi:glycosyltransferase involved in cell wall biosynthesis